MSDANPFATSGQPMAPPLPSVRRVPIGPIDLLQRGYELIREDYWLFLGLVLVTLLLASFVPFGILFGPMLVGLTLCFLEKESQGKTSFDTLFKGFDSFGPSFVAYLIHAAIMIGVMIAWILVAAICVLVVVLLCAAVDLPEEAIGIVGTLGALVGYMGIFLITMPLQYAMVFSMQSIADQHLEAWDSVVLGYKTIWKNLGGYLWLFIVWAFLSFALLIMCFLPLLLFAPIMQAGLFVLYRDLVPKSESLA